jgi:YesN/AraC family two-component response regulator
MNPPERVAELIRLLLLIADNDKERIIARPLHIDKDKRRMQQIKTYVVCNAKQGITIDDIARHIGMNRASFCVFFKKVAGQTFINYLNEYRVTLACRLLKENKLRISDVCFQTGFNDIPYFNRVFKKIKGCSPREFRKRAATSKLSLTLMS